jgi:phosphomannomutase
MVAVRGASLQRFQNCCMPKQQHLGGFFLKKNPPCATAGNDYKYCGTALSGQLKGLYAKVGSFCPVRENFRLTPRQKVAFTERLKADLEDLSGRKVVQVVRTNRPKLIFEEGSWICLRLSGTDPVTRTYTEVPNQRDMQTLRLAAERFVLES